MKRVYLALLLIPSISTWAQTERLFIYPAGGQSEQRLELDRYQCHRWAVDKTGVNPATLTEPPATRTVVQNPNRGAGAIGTLIGTIAGAAIGAQVGHHRHSGEIPGALIGAAIGSAIGGEKERDGRKQARAEAQKIAQDKAHARNQYRADLDNYNRAFTACMTARDYSVR